MLNIPEPVAAADTDFDAVISLSEFRQAAAMHVSSLLEARRAGRLDLDELQARRAAAWAERKSKRKDNAADVRVGNPLPAGNPADAPKE